MLCTMLALSLSLVTVGFMQLDDGCPFSLQVKHVLSFQGDPVIRRFPSGFTIKLEG
jgi:hypothetical protein